jgi:tight adherence protein C
MTIYLISVSLAFGCFTVLDAVMRRKTLLDRLVRSAARDSFWQKALVRAEARLKKVYLSRKRQQQVLRELPEILDMMAVALTAGDSLFSALARISSRATGELASELHRMFMALELGSDFEAELNELAKRLPHRQVAEFAGKLTLGLRRGNPLAEMIREQSNSAKSDLRNELLRQAGRNETRMLIPLVFLILPVTVLFAVYPSLQLLKVSYI